MMLILGRRNSLNVRKVLWLCEELGLAYAREDWGRGVRSAQSAAFLRLNPNGRIPVLVQDDLVLWESHAILRHLARTHDGGHRLYGANAQGAARVDQWLDWTLSVCAPPMHVVFQAFRAGGDDALTTPAAAAAKREVAAAFSLVGAQLGDRAHIAADRFTIADCALGVHLHRAASLDLLDPGDDALSRYHDRLRSRRAYGTTVDIGAP